MLKIANSSLLYYRSLGIDEQKVVYRDGTGLRDEKTFAYGDVSAVLLSAQNVLSIQISYQIFKIEIQPNNPDHQHFMTMLARWCRQSLPPLTVS